MSAPLPLPIDIRLMNWTAAVLLLGCVVAAVVVLGSWVAGAPVFALTRVSVEGELAHTSAAQLRADVGPRLAGNFFTVDLQAVRQAFEQLPWVKSARVQREFPGTLRVRLTEQRVVAYWGEPGGDALVNREGEVFEADASGLEDSGLPRLRGAPEQSAQMLAMLGQIAPALSALGAPIDTLTLSEHGSWRALLASGAQVELGSGDAPLLLTRARRLTDTLARVAQQQGRRIDQLEYADLRYASGYALRLKGVTTVSGDAPRLPAPRTSARNHQRG